jgi:DNA integrity scanning protein DisA with diadenylate cyclase activity
MEINEYCVELCKRLRQHCKQIEELHMKDSDTSIYVKQLNDFKTTWEKHNTKTLNILQATINKITNDKN